MSIITYAEWLDLVTATIRGTDLSNHEDLNEENFEKEYATHCGFYDDNWLEDPVQYIITGNTITLTKAEQVEVVTSDNENFTSIRQAVLDNNFDLAFELMNIGSAIEAWGNGLLTIKGGVVTHKGTVLTNKLVDRVIRMMQKGDSDFERFAKFISLVLKNPSFKNRERLMDFAAADDIEIDENGMMIGFKNVREDYFDKHSGTVRYKVGDEPEEDRAEVDDRDENTCSRGLHFCSVNYLKGFWGKSGRNMLVQVDPRDVVSIPEDYQDSKGRVCKMKVIKEITGDEAAYGF